MKKMTGMMLALATVFAVGSVRADEQVVAKAEVANAAAPVDEQAFTEKLGERHRKLFSMMTAEQKKAAMTAAVDSADVAVENVMKDQHLSMAKGEAKAEKK